MTLSADLDPPRINNMLFIIILLFQFLTLRIGINTFVLDYINHSTCTALMRMWRKDF